MKIPEGLKVGDTFRGHSPKSWYFTNRDEQTFTVVEEWGIWDPTQVGFWSGRQNRDFYLWMFVPFARAVKQTNPDVKVIGGWDFGLSHGDWAVWQELYKPVIDATHEQLDGITDHHYGLNSRWVPMWYEVACAYSVNKYGKWLKGYNTECGGKLDPAVHGEAKNISGTSEGTYALRDIMELLYHSPAKSGSRTAHHPDKGVLETLAFLKDLRGQLMTCYSGDPDIWPVASINGDKLVIVVFNNAREVRRLQTRIPAPAGTKLGQGRWQLDHEDKSGNVEVSGNQAEPTFDLPPYRAAKIVLPLEGKLDSSTVLQRKQYFAAGEPLVDVPAGKDVTLKIDIPAKQLDGIQNVWLKVMLQNVDDGEVSVQLNGGKLGLPSRNFTTQFVFNPEAVKASNTLRFHGGGDGYRVVVASLLIETK
ncbi:MAG: hypothetical protein ACOCZE_06960 [Planctomycetota bacterium]